MLAKKTSCWLNESCADLSEGVLVWIRKLLVKRRGLQADNKRGKEELFERTQQCVERVELEGLLG